MILSGLFLLIIFVAPALSIHAHWLTAPQHTRSRPVNLLAAFVIVGATEALVLLLMTRIGLVGFGWSWLLAAIAMGVAVVMGLLAHRRRDASLSSPDVRLLVLVGVGLAVCSLPGWIAVLGRLDTIGRIAGWYYWGVVQDVIAAKGFPPTTIEWGLTTDFFNFHVVFSALGAATAEASGAAQSLASVQAIRLAAAFAMPAAAYLAARAWGAERLASFGGALLVAATWVAAAKPVGYVPEGLGYILAVLLLGLIHAALVGRQRVAQVALVLGMAALTQIHGVTGTFTYLAVLGGLAAFVVLPRNDISLQMRLRVAFTVGLAAVIGALAVGSILGARASSASILEDSASLTADGVDPTWEFVILATTSRTIDEAQRISQPPTNAEILAGGATRGFLQTPRVLSWFAIAGIVFLGLWAALAADDRKRARTALATMLLGVGFVVGAGILLALPYETYVPRRTGVGRLAQLWIIIPPVFAPVFAHLLRRRAVTAAALGVGVLLWGAAATGVVADGRIATSEQISELAALPIEPGSRLLTNAWTQGFIRGTTPTTGLLDGQAPYLNPALLPYSLEMLEDVRAFYFQPGRNASVLEKYEVEYVLIGHDRSSFGGTARFAAAPEKLARLAQLRVVQASDLYTLLAVIDQASP